MFYWILKLLFGLFVRMIWIKKVEGMENMPPKGAYIIAANHTSYFDFFSLIAVWPKRIYFLAGEVFFNKWWWYPLVKFTGQIKVDRVSGDKEEVYQKVFSVLNKGKVLAIFPEGTRSANGKIGKTFTGVAKFALVKRVQVVPVGITGAYEVMSRHRNLPGFVKKIEIKVGKPINFDEYYGREYNEAVYREITDRIMGQVAMLAGQKT